MDNERTPRVVLILIAGAFINSTGNSLLWPLNSLFMHDVLGRTLTQAGLIMAIQSGLNLTGQFLSGLLADRIGVKRVMLFGLLMGSATVGLIGAFPTYAVYAPGIILLGLAYALIFVPLHALISIVWPEGGRRGFNYLYMASNAGVAVGTSLGGIVAQTSFRLVFIINAITFFVYLLIVFFGVPKSYKVSKSQIKTEHVEKTVFMDKGFKVLAALCGGVFLVWIAYSQWTTILPVVMKMSGFALPAYSFLWTLNGVFIVTLQPLVNWLIKFWARSFQRQFYLACMLISSSFLILEGRFPYTAYIVAMLLLTLGEMLILPAIPTVVAYLAPRGKEGTYQGIAAGSGSGGRTLGPLLGGMVFDHWGGSMVWLMALGFVLAAYGVFVMYGMFENRLGIAEMKKVKIG